MPDQELVHLTIDGVPVEVPKGTLLVEAAKHVKQEIPVYCYHTKLGPAGLCRVCLVEIEGMPKLQIACNTPVAEGMVVRTQNERVNAGRGMVVELLLVNHPLDCPICDKGGECDLQDYAMAYGRGTSAVVDAKASKPKAADLGPTIVLDEERCIVCQRCVRFDDIIADEQQLVVKDRGYKDIIATASGEPYNHNFTGNVTEICPVGALTSKTYRFKSRPWDLNRTQTTCTHCSVGCQQFSDVRFGGVLRTMSVESDDAISDGWLCDRGRYNIGFYASHDRITQPLYKRNGEFVQVSWDDAFAVWGKAIRDAIAAHGVESVGVIGGGRLLNEEAYLLQHVFRGVRVQNIDWRTGAQRQAMPGAQGGSLVALEKADAIVVLGGSPNDLAPVLDLRIRKAALRNHAVVVYASDVETARKAVAESAKNIAIVWDGVDVKLANEVFNVFASRNVMTYIAGEQANSRGAATMLTTATSVRGDMVGLPNDIGGFLTEEMLQRSLDGAMGVLSLFGANLVRNYPAGASLKEALGKVPFVVVSELFMTETAELATLVLPAKGAFEKSGTVINLAGDLLPVNQSLQPPESVLSDGEMLVGLAQQLEVTLPSAEELDATVIRLAAQKSAGVFGDPKLAVRVTPDEKSDQDRAVKKLFDGGGTAAHDPSIKPLRVAAGIEPAQVELNAEMVSA